MGVLGVWDTFLYTTPDLAASQEEFPECLISHATMAS